MGYASYTIGNLEREVEELREKNTILKAERDEFERQRDEAMDVANRIAKWSELTDEQRLEFLESLPCCRHCGSLDTGCQCWNDE